MGLKTDIERLRYKPVPKGWRTSAQIARDEPVPVSMSTVRLQLRQLVQAGLWEMRRWHVKESTGYYKPCPIYRKKP